MPIEVESPEELGYDTIANNLAESSFSDLRLAGNKGSIDIEGWHDPVYRDDLEVTGQKRALDYLMECRGGTTFVPERHVELPRATA